MQKAFEGAPGSAEYAEDLERLMRRIPESHCEALQASAWGPTVFALHT